MHVLSNYSPSVDNRVLGVALATMIVTLPEAIWLRNIRNRQLKGWFTGTRLTLDEAKEVLEWRTMTCGVLICHKNGRWGNSTPRDEAVELFNALQIVSNNGAFERLGVMVWPSYHRCSEAVLDDKQILKIKEDMNRMAQRRGWSIF